MIVVLLHCLAYAMTSDDMALLARAERAVVSRLRAMSTAGIDRSIAHAQANVIESRGAPSVDTVRAWAREWNDAPPPC